MPLVQPYMYNIHLLFIESKEGMIKWMQNVTLRLTNLKNEKNLVDIHLRQLTFLINI